MILFADACAILEKAKYSDADRAIIAEEDEYVE
jgi:hypothetical protein